MFSFVQWFRTLIDGAKRKKGLWFTLLSVMSLAGIFISLYFVNFLVSDVAKKTYENQKQQFNLRLANQIVTHKERTLAIATTVTQNESIKNIFFRDDENVTRDIKKSADELKMRISQTLDSKNFAINFKRSEKFTELKMINGLIVKDDRAKFQTLMPLVKTDKFVSSIVVTENIESLVSIFKKEKKEFLFMLNDSSINKIEKTIQKSKYTKIFEKFYIKSKSYDLGFVEETKSINYEKLKNNGYLKTSQYFYVLQKMFNTDGDEIGIAMIAQNMSDDNSFVNLVKNLVNSVTTVAIGLIVSMILFLF
jgi:hypothetical protein